jgi:7-keto-8-aminopelargonate synthetase-like enzyme
VDWNANQYSLADFYLPDTDDPLKPPQDYLTWRRDTAWATSLYEPILGEAAGPTGTLQTETGPQRVINMTSYGYLGLVRHPRIIAAAKEALDTFGTGACGSPILSGKSVRHRELEQKLSLLTGQPAVLVFNSGFGGALGSAAGLMRKGDVAIADARAHVSLLDGVRVGGARIALFEHNDPASLDEVLTATTGKRRLIFVDGIYSMDGDMADLPALLDVAESHGVGLFVDEAHSILCCGATGGGVVEHFGVRARVGVQYGTFSKGFSSAGGFASASQDLIEYLRFYANPYGFTCALPPAVVAGLCTALDVMKEETWRRDRLWENGAYFRAQLQALGVNTGNSSSYVVPIVVGENRALLYELGHALRQHGLFVTPVDYPTVPLDQARFRASVTTEHSRADLDEALQIIQDVFVPVMRARGLLRQIATSPPRHITTSPPRHITTSPHRHITTSS